MKTVEIAESYIGEKELPNNKFTDDTKLGRLLHAAGQRDGESWCCYLMEGVFVEAYPQCETVIRKLFSAGVDRTMRNLIAAGFPLKKDPLPGDLMIMKHFEDGKELWQGHIGLVTLTNNDATWRTVEGNTNNDGSSNGNEVLPKTRYKTFKRTGLNVVGFISFDPTTIKL